MKSTVESLEPTKVKLTVEVTYDELKPSIDHAYKHIAEQVQVPGFRKGKVPARIIDQRVGRAAVLEHAINESLGGFYSEAARENELRPLGRPDVDVTRVPDTDDTSGELHFTAEVEIRPEVELPDLSSITLTVDDLEVTDAEVDERVTLLRERFGTLVGVDRPAADTDFVVIDLEAKADGEVLDSVKGISYQIGSESMLDGLDEALDGLSAGESTTFTSALVAGENAGRDSEITVTVEQVKERQLPEADDDFAQLASEFDTFDELVADLREQAGQQKEQGRVTQARDLLLAEFDKIEVPLPSGVIETEVHSHLEGEGRLEDETHRAEVTEEVKEGLRRQIVLDTLAEKLSVKVGQGELLEFLLNAARQYGQDPNEFIRNIDSSGQIPGVVAEVARSKSVVLALRDVTIVDGAGNSVDISEYLAVPEDTEDDEAAEGSED
ncbi:trigger factor [Rarobacter faecitabidus]|uniref:Trigger factor n=1 Tax=Rarobacter faecitabidus TaxID=13243 RepID=A0A542ZWK1_RARFA|nr:trigger factor [Rarobacter faecitabidus]TQL64731.1 trigger factor [Rarobacter faecitabidus]